MAKRGLGGRQGLCPICFLAVLFERLIGVRNAQVAELVDAPASGAGYRKIVEVQVLSWAPV